MHFILLLSPSNPKYDPFVIIYDWVMKQRYVLYVFLHSYIFTTCGVVCIKLAHSSLGDRKHIFITLIIIVKLGESIIAIVVTFCLGCVPEAAVPWLLCSLMICANNKVHYDPVFVILCLHIKLPHYHHYADLSEIHWASNRLARYILPRVVCLSIRFTHFS